MAWLAAGLRRYL